MSRTQTGILALGTLSHAYLELDRRDGRDPDALVAAAAGVVAASATVGGVNLVVGFRPQLWAVAAPAAAPAGVTGFDAPVVGPDGFTMPPEQGPLQAMLASMAGCDGPRDELTRYARPLTGAYYVVPAADALLGPAARARKSAL